MIMFPAPIVGRKFQEFVQMQMRDMSQSTSQMLKLNIKTSCAVSRALKHSFGSATNPHHFIRTLSFDAPVTHLAEFGGRQEPCAYSTNVDVQNKHCKCRRLCQPH